MLRRGRTEESALLALCSRIDGERVSLLELALVPVWIRRYDGAGGVQSGNLIGCEIPSGGRKILPQLFFCTRTDDDVRDGGTLQQPVQRDLRNRLSGFLGYFIESIDDFEKILVRNRRALLGRAVQPAYFRQRLIAPNLSRESSPTERAPHNRGDLLIESERHASLSAR